MGRVRRVTPVAWAVLFLLLVQAGGVQAAPSKRVVWKASETVESKTIHGTWTWDGEHKWFVGRWSNGAIAHIKIKRLDKRQVILTRYDPKGKTAGLKARYVGDRKGDLFQGTVEWSWKGKVSRGTWKGRKVPGIRLNRARFATERRHLETPTERRAFPRLGDDFEVLAPHTKVYNCIAWSIGFTDRWIWPKKPTLAGFDRLYEKYGYRRIPTLDFTLVPGMQKIVLYARRTKKGKLKYTHGARQGPDGTWTSKIGKLPRIRHLSPQAISGPSYGKPIAVYVKFAEGEISNEKAGRRQLVP
jgi:hypothetical protein